MADGAADAQQRPEACAGRDRQGMFLGLAAALVACAGVRVWLIAHTDVIAPDAVTYVRMAREWSASPGRVVQDYDYPVGYPVAVAAMHRAVVGLGGPRGIDGWDLAGQLVSLAAAVGAMVAVWLFAVMAFDHRVAWVAASLFGIGRKWSVLGADALSDAMALCFQMWAVVLSLLVARQLRRGSGKAVVLAACVGACSGVSYLARPEGLLAVALGVALWLGCLVVRRENWRLTLAAAAAAVVLAAACVLPYAAAIGALTKKKSIDDFVRSSRPAALAAVAASAAPAGPHNPPSQLVRQLFEAMHPALGFAACVWAGGFGITRLWRPRGARLAVPPPRPAAAFMMLAALAVLVPLLMCLYRGVHYLSHRHLMFLAALLCPLAGVGVLMLADLAGAVLRRVGAGRVGRSVVLAVVVGALAVPVALHTLRPLRRGRWHFRRAAEWLARRARPDDRIVTDSAWIVHYSGLGGTIVPIQDLTCERLGRSVERGAAAYVVLADESVQTAALVVADVPGPFRLVEVAAFPASGPGAGGTVRVYRVDRTAAGSQPRGRGPAPPGRARRLPCG